MRPTAIVVFAAALACDGKTIHSVARAPQEPIAVAPAVRAMGPAAYPLKLLPRARYLVDQNDRPFLLTGDSAWSLFVALTDEEAAAYLEDRRARGFDAVLVEMIENKYCAEPPKNVYGVAPFRSTLPGTNTPDFSTPNEAYFTHVDRIVAIAAKKGILLEITPAYLGYGGGDEGWYRQMKANGVSRLAAYGTFLGNRYKSSPNILWVEGGDTDPTVEGIDPAFTRAIATSLRASDPNHLHTVHGHPGRSAPEAWSGEAWIDVSTIYTYPRVVNETPVYVKALAERARPEAKPFFLIESTYEADKKYRPSAQLVRQQAYEALLNGAAGQNFGRDEVWFFAAGWRSMLDSQGARDITRLVNLFAARTWQRLIPDGEHTFVTAGFGAGPTYVSAAVTGDGALGIAYVPGGSAAIVVNIAKVTGRKIARWYDPTSGTFTAIAVPSSSGFRSFAPPGKNAAGDSDWVFVLEST